MYIHSRTPGPLEKSKYMAESMEKVMEKSPRITTEASKLVSFALKKATSPMGLVSGTFYGYFRSAFVCTVGLTT